MNSSSPKSYNSLSLITGAISLILATSSSSGYAAGHEHQTNQEKCAGIVKAGQNDCASVEHACAGLNTDDGYESDWVWLPKGTCSKIAEAHILKNNS